jgi:predicted nucleic acid-binding protein
MQVYILNSYAIMEFLRQQKSWEIVADLFNQSTEGNAKLKIHILNWGEIWYTLIREKGKEIADEFLTDFQSQIDVEIIDFSKSVFERAVQFKSQGNISYSDCFAISAAVEHNAILVTGDKEFKQLEDQVRILWL